MAINRGGIIFFAGICDHLAETHYINKSNVVAVTFKNCEISDLSNIFQVFPNLKKLSFLENNTLPSTDFSHVEHLSLFVNNGSKFKKKSFIIVFDNWSQSGNIPIQWDPK